MKKLASILVLVFAFTITTQAQKKGKRDQNNPKFTIEQRTELAIKKMTLALDLTEKQQSQITPFIKAQATARKAAMEKRKQYRDEEKKPSADEIYAMKSNQLDNRIAFKNNMKDILNKEQFEKFEKMAKNRAQKGREMMKKGLKKRRMAEDKR